MPQDVRASIVTTLSNLSVAHNGGTVTLRAAYWSDRYSNVHPAVFVRELAASYETDIGNSAEIADGVYDLAIVALDRQASGSEPAIDAEVFLKDAASAINTALKAVKNDLGGAYGVRLINSRDVEVEWTDGVLVFTRILTYRAHTAA